MKSINQFKIIKLYYSKLNNKKINIFIYKMNIINQNKLMNPNLLNYKVSSINSKI